MCQGVMKSGSPTPREITSSSPETRSKKRRIPEGGIFFTVSAINFEGSHGGLKKTPL
jgi:hypothetical protein